MLWGSALMLMAGIVQSVVLARYMGPSAVNVDLVTVLLASWSLLRGFDEGVLLGAIAGLGMDLMSGGPLGVNFFILSMIGGLVGLGQTRIYRSNVPLLVTVGMASSLLEWVAGLVVLQAVGWPAEVSLFMVTRLLSSAMLSGALMPPAYYLTRWMHGQVSRGGPGDRSR